MQLMYSTVLADWAIKSELNFLNDPDIWFCFESKIFVQYINFAVKMNIKQETFVF